MVRCRSYSARLNRIFKLTEKQVEANQILRLPSRHTLFEGGSRSTKTFTILRCMVYRALKAPNSRHVALRFRFNHIKASIGLDTFPKMMGLCFPDVKYNLSKADWYITFPNGSELWLGGLDDKLRTEKILGNEYASIFFNEVSQISLGARNTALTRLAQRCPYTNPLTGDEEVLKLKAFYDCNPPSKAHWIYKLFHKRQDPDSNKPLMNGDQYSKLLMNPRDNAENLPLGYLEELENMPVRLRLRFLDGLYSEVDDSALWTIEILDKWRADDRVELPDFQRVVVAVDPSGADDDPDKNNDAIGITVTALGVDGNAYLLEDLTVKAGPATWGKVAASAFERHDADLIVAEQNYGGEMVRYVLKTAKPDAHIKLVNASRGKVLRAEPISSLHEQGKVRLVGVFPELEDELCGFTTTGYIGDRSPNRADAFVFGVTELFPGLTRKEKRVKKRGRPIEHNVGSTGWMMG